MRSELHSKIKEVEMVQYVNKTTYSLETRAGPGYFIRPRVVYIDIAYKRIILNVN